MNSFFFGTLTTSHATPLPAGGGGGGIPSLVAKNGVGGTINGVTTEERNTSGANFIIINVAWYIAASANVVLTDSYGNTWDELTLHGNIGTDQAGQKFFYKYNPIVGAGHTFSANANDSYPSIQMAGFNNIASSPFDLQNGTASESISWTTIQPGSITPSQANTIVFVGLSRGDNSNGSISIDNGYAVIDDVDNAPGDHLGGALAYKILTSSSAQNPTWTSANTCARGAAGIASFKF